MSIIDKLATSLGRRDEVPNEELARQIAADQDADAVRELVANLSNKDKGIQSDCIKTLYEIGAQKPALISGYISDFIGLLSGKNNRLQWGAMTALNAVAGEKPDEIFAALPQLAIAAEGGSVITRDNYVGILIRLLAVKKFADDVFPLLNEQLLGSPANQLPMYAEQTQPAIPAHHRETFRSTLTGRLGDFEKASKRVRVEKVLKKLGK